MTEPRGEYSSLRVSQMLPGAIVGVVGHAFAILAARVVDRAFASSQGGSLENAEVTATFLAAELLVVLTALIVGRIFIPKEKRAVRAGLFLGWLLGAVAVWIFARGY